MVSEHVLGAIDEVDDFVRVFVEKRKSTDYLSIGGTNLRRFSLEDIALYKETFKQVQYSSTMRKPTDRSFTTTSVCVSSLDTLGGIFQHDTYSAVYFEYVAYHTTQAYIFHGTAVVRFTPLRHMFDRGLSAMVPVFTWSHILATGGGGSTFLF